MHWSQRRALLALAMVGALLLAACDDDGDALDDAVQGAEGIDRQAILNDVNEVRALLEETASTADSESMTDVDYDGEQLTVVVTEDFAGIEAAEAFCRELSEAVGAADTGIAITDEAGSILATCRLES